MGFVATIQTFLIGEQCSASGGGSLECRLGGSLECRLGGMCSLAMAPVVAGSNKAMEQGPSVSKRSIVLNSQIADTNVMAKPCSRTECPKIPKICNTRGAQMLSHL